MKNNQSSQIVPRSKRNRFPRPKFIPSGKSEIWQLRQAFEEADVTLTRYFAQKGWKC